VRTPSSALRRRFKSAPSDTRAHCASRARTPVSRHTYPRATCTNRVRIHAATAPNPRNRTGPRVSGANSFQVAGKTDTKGCQFVSRRVRFFGILAADRLLFSRTRPDVSAYAAPQGVQRVAPALGQHKTRVLELDLYASCDNIRHYQVLAKVARRVNDAGVLHLLKLTLKASGKNGVAQGGVLSPLLSNLYLTEVDQMRERAKEVTRSGL
jgi:hypothetical protein